MKLYALICFLIFNFSITTAFSQQQPASIIPEFTLFKTDGTAFTKKQVLNDRASLFSFFDVTCSHCLTTMLTFNKHAKELKNLSVYLVSLDRKDAVLKFMNTNAPALLNSKNVTILIDVNYEFIPKFLPKKYPAVFVYDKNHRLKYYEGDEKNMDQLIKKAKAVN